MIPARSQATLTEITDVEREPAAALLARAFADDPALSYIFPDPDERRRRLPRLFRIIFAADGRAGPRTATHDGKAVAFWRTPDRARTGRGEMLRYALPLLGAFGSALGRGLRVADAIDAHMPTGPFWYLHVIACDPSSQYRGHATRLLHAGLDAFVGDGAAYVETARRDNVAFYEKVGFRLVGEWSVEKDGPRFWSLWRAAAGEADSMSRAAGSVGVR